MFGGQKDRKGQWRKSKGDDRRKKMKQLEKVREKTGERGKKKWGN